MLLGDFFKWELIKADVGNIEGMIKVNPNHQIFKGHFPGQPVVPGVCTMQMIKEVLEKELGISCMIRSASNIKFLAMIVPGIHSSVKATIQFERRDEVISLNAVVSGESATFFKMQAVLAMI